MEKFNDTELPDIPAMPQQPADFDFPKCPFGKTMPSCQASWFKQFSFLHYDAARVSEATRSNLTMTGFQNFPKGAGPQTPLELHALHVSEY